MISTVVLLAVIVFIIVFIVGIYNKLITLRNRYKNAYSQIDVQLKRRYDLIPNLVETAKAYLKHEKETLEAVINARNQAQAANDKAAAQPGDAGSMKQLLGAEAALAGAMGKFYALVENYPDLKANQNMMQLSEELTSTENRVAFARQSYNDGVTTYNSEREKFPNNMIANNFGFKEAILFLIEDEKEKVAVKVSFD